MNLPQAFDPYSDSPWCSEEADKLWAMDPVQRDRSSQGIQLACFVSSRLFSYWLFALQT